MKKGLEKTLIHRYNNKRSLDSASAPDGKQTEYLGVAQFGSVLEWGSRGRKFESSHPDSSIAG